MAGRIAEALLMRSEVMEVAMLLDGSFSCAIKNEMFNVV